MLLNTLLTSAALCGLLGPIRVSSTRVRTKITDIVLFGDSFTDQSRQHSIANGTYPGKEYQEIYPPADHAANGGIQWPRYLGFDGDYKIWNYAVGGAACSNKLTPFYGVPDVSSGQLDWFIQDHVTSNGTKQQHLALDPETFTVVMFIGTNDVGIKSFITGDQAWNVTLVDLADCQLDAIRRMHALGARHFILNSLIPLHLTRLYTNESAGTVYWPQEHDGAAWHKSAYNVVHTLNRLLRDGVRALNEEFCGGVGRVEWFDTYRFFHEMYDHPVRYFNGTVPVNSTGHCHQCPDPNDYRQCGVGDCTTDQRDSFMWWDELHPSEQTGRQLATEIHRKIEGRSQY